jgi:hypothetical protein
MNGLEMNMVMLVSKKVWYHGRLITARSRLVVATTLHKQLSSFRLRISSNTPSCSEESREWNTLANPKGTRFLFCKPGLRNVWMNRHNLRQDCNLEELINQANRPLNKLHPRSTASIAQTQKSSESSPTSRLIFFLHKERWRLGEDILRVHEQSRLASKYSFWARPEQGELAPQTRCSWIANRASDAQGESNEQSFIKGFKQITTW